MFKKKHRKKNTANTHILFKFYKKSQSSPCVDIARELHIEIFGKLHTL